MVISQRVIPTPKPSRQAPVKSTDNVLDLITQPMETCGKYAAMILDLFSFFGKRHRPGRALKAHPDANIAWKYSSSGHYQNQK